MKKIINDAYYLINKFSNDNKTVKPAKLQILMYLVECYYMCKYDKLYLYKDTNFVKNWINPFNIPLFNEFKHFNGKKINLTKKQQKKIKNIDIEVKHSLDEIYKNCKDFSFFDLARIINTGDTPNQILGIKEHNIISKLEMKKWFTKYFII